MIYIIILLHLLFKKNNYDKITDLGLYAMSNFQDTVSKLQFVHVLTNITRMPSWAATSINFINVLIPLYLVSMLDTQTNLWKSTNQ